MAHPVLMPEAVQALATAWQAKWKRMQTLSASHPLADEEITCIEQLYTLTEQVYLIHTTYRYGGQHSIANMHVVMLHDAGEIELVPSITFQASTHFVHKIHERKDEQQ